jgi:hypothetical protein
MTARLSVAQASVSLPIDLEPEAVMEVQNAVPRGHLHLEPERVTAWAPGRLGVVTVEGWLGFGLHLCWLLDTRSV